MNVRHLAIILLIIPFFCACQSNDSSESSPILKDLQDTVASMKEKVTGTDIDSLANQELEKLFTFEYQVEELPAETSVADLNLKLTEMGAQRWECFHVEEKATAIRLYCKRRPKTYLRYVPRIF